MQENNILRLAMVLDDSAATTLEKYICKLVEAVIYNSNVSLDLTSICANIDSQFGLIFDVGEIESALRKKGGDRIICEKGLYNISTKVKNQMASQIDPIELLKGYISEYAKNSSEPLDETAFLECIMKYLYHCFNSTRKNLMNLLQNKIIIVDEVFSPSNREIMLINGFINWDNDDKNELFYKIIVLSYEYCMLTTKQNELLSKRIFRGKRFFLDTNIIFRMAGINKDERKFVTDSFVKKCSEVGIELCYTNETLGELFRVINAQIKYIRHLTQGHTPINSQLIKKIGGDIEQNDFYVIYYNWSKNPSNNYRDFVSFQKYLVESVTASLAGLKMVTINNYLHHKNSDSFTKACSELKQYKNNKRPLKLVTEESLQADINNIFYILSIRKKTHFQAIWQVNDFLVSADQLLMSWAEQAYPGIPVVVIPSTWLSIILRFSGRTRDDYKSYCLFMSLRQRRFQPDEIIINPVKVIEELSQKTSDVEIKEKIITELITNKNYYKFSTDEDTSTSVDRAFDKIVSELKSENEKFIISTTSKLRDEFQNEKTTLEQQLVAKSSEQEYIIKYAHKKASRKVDFFKKFSWFQPILNFLGITIAIIAMIAYLYKWVFVYELFVRLGPLLSVFLTLVMSLLPSAIKEALKYLSSNERRENLVRKYRLEAEKNMNYQ